MREWVVLHKRHVEDGVSLRALAREYGTHASTIMRRVRAVECARDDLLMDSAVSQETSDVPEEDIIAALKLLAEKGTEIMVAPSPNKVSIRKDDVILASFDEGVAKSLSPDLLEFIAGRRDALEQDRTSDLDHTKAGYSFDRTRLGDQRSDEDRARPKALQRDLGSWD